MKYFASISFGKDSLAMLLRLIEENKPLDEVVFYDTGMEFECIYNLRNNSGTTESLPLIASSIMSKKIASGANIILIDIRLWHLD